jgi:hypothetical protein
LVDGSDRQATQHRSSKTHPSRQSPKRLQFSYSVLLPLLSFSDLCFWNLLSIPIPPLSLALLKMAGTPSPPSSPPRSDQMGRNANIKDIGEATQSDETDSGWRNRSHLTLLIENIPGPWMVADLKEFLDGFGNIVKLEIFEDREVLAIS